ncbi:MULTISPECIES: hypothetical protein [unclassified Streptococcus]|uniref:hypothetical protein n=1 Tax=unclassified Streptococcus TaxID=2608887 RepID=UPI0020C88A3F|nr:MULTISPECIES: hypothetical protein [unclassified Streptococcus]MCP9036677.1 hypothetical protein [Streptococcus sp. CF8_Ac1-9]MCP9044139.1 hypothetical protein [Streptococcus sp. CF8_Ac1-11]
MKPNFFKLFAGIPLILCCLFLSSCKIMKPSDYKKAKEVVTEVFKENDLHGKVTITKLSWTALEYPQYHVSYAYSEKTYDDQTVQLEDEDVTFKDDWSGSYSSFLPSYKEAFLKQKSIKNIEEKLETEIKKQSLGLPISFFGFLSNSNRDEKEQILDSIASQNLKEGKKDFAGYYQIPFQTLIDQELIRMTIYIEDGVSVKEKDLKAAAKKLDASKLPDGAYDFYYSKGSYADSISYSFKVKDGKVVFYEDQKERVEGQN